MDWKKNGFKFYDIDIWYKYCSSKLRNIYLEVSIFNYLWRKIGELKEKKTYKMLKLIDCFDYTYISTQLKLNRLNVI